MTDFFSPDYSTARDRFCSAVLKNGGQIESIALTEPGALGEPLTIDIGWFGAETPRRAVVHSSGLHGVEGFAGSAIQLQWMSEAAPVLPSDGAIAVVHALNPYGMSWLRRVNADNVDLNHNFLSADETYSGAPPVYAALNSFLNPTSPDFFPLRAAFAAARHGVLAIGRALATGQYEFPAGLSYGGAKRTQEARRFQLYISGRLGSADRIVAIDVHTGPGKDDFKLDKSGPVAGGSLAGLYHRMFPSATVGFAQQRFGIGSRWKTLSALRAENRRHFHGGAGPDLRELFCPTNPQWRAKVLAQGRDAITQALTAAFGSVAANRVTAD